MTDRVALDTNVLDWLLEPANLATLLELQNQEMLEPVVTAEVAYEINRMPDNKAAKREALQGLIREHFKPVRPTFVPIAGLARAGLAFIATPQTEAFLTTVRQRGLRKLHVTNAHFHRCAAFLTLDGRLLKKQGAIRDLTFLKLERPEVRVCRSVEPGR
jgi:hypothetical protein